VNIRSITAPNPSPLTLDGTRTYLLGETTVLDPGPDIASHVEAILDAQPQLEVILITHRHDDHAPAAVPLRKATGARIIAPAGVLADDLVHQRLSGGERLMIDGMRLEVIATPGHTSEHVCFLTDEGDLFTGDTVLGSGTTAIFPPDGSMRAYLRSLELLLSKKPKRIHPAHGPTRDDATPVIEEYIAHRLQREAQILEALDGGATTVREIREKIYTDIDPRLHPAAEIQIRAHLIKLEDEHRLVHRITED
jgi:glyoxylase-like metal-dependent hydrolase (beta-lactamase superfamily II)